MALGATILWDIRSRLYMNLSWGGLICLCCINLASERVGVVGGKMEDTFTLKEIVTVFFGTKKIKILEE